MVRSLLYEAEKKEKKGKKKREKEKKKKKERKKGERRKKGKRRKKGDFFLLNARPCTKDSLARGRSRRRRRRAVQLQNDAVFEF